VVTSIILIISCAPKPPHETGTFKAGDLVELVKLDTSIHLISGMLPATILQANPFIRKQEHFCNDLLQKL
jgi:hypothetical protein